MGIREVERSILAELQKVLDNPKILTRDMLEWRTSEIQLTDEGEVVIYLPEMGVWVCVKKELDKQGEFCLP